VKHESFDRIYEFVEWDKLMQASYFKQLCHLVYAETDFATLLKRFSENNKELTNHNLEYFIQDIIQKFTQHSEGSALMSLTLDVKTLQKGLLNQTYLNPEISSEWREKAGQNYIQLLGIYNNPLILVYKAYRIDILYNLMQDGHPAKLSYLEEQLNRLKTIAANVNLEDCLKLKQFKIHKGATALHEYSFTSGFQYSLMNEILSFECANIRFELGLMELYFYWLHTLTNKEENPNEPNISSIGNSLSLPFSSF